MDVGETLEDCVKREVAEEVGMEVESIKYKCSQHWPFPAGSIMIGCHAEAKPGQQPDPCQVELEDARWFNREEVREMVDRIEKNPRLRVGGRQVVQQGGGQGDGGQDRKESQTKSWRTPGGSTGRRSGRWWTG